MPAPTGRRSIRLAQYDYSSAGAYFVTTCTHHRQPLFAHAAYRKLAEQAWNWLPTRFPNVELDEIVLMPDHLHFIIWLLEGDRRGGHLAAQTPTLGIVVGAFKTVVARSINAARETRGWRVWQRNYYEHIIRTDDELERIRDYIQSNPLVAHGHESDDLAPAWQQPA